MAVSEAMTELGRLDASASLLPNPHLIARIAPVEELLAPTCRHLFVGF